MFTKKQRVMPAYLMGAMLCFSTVILLTQFGCGGKQDIQITSQKPEITEDNIKDTAQVMAEASNAVVRITTQYGTYSSSGTGVVVNPQGYILTNNHVVEQGYQSTILFSDGKSLRADIVYRDITKDIAFLRCPDGSYQYKAVGGNKQVTLGQDVVAIGYPLGANLGDSASISKGIISAFRDFGGIKYIQTDAALNPGSSGGALLNMYGELIGITSLKVKASEGLAFAIDLNEMKEYLTNTIGKLSNNELQPIKTVPQQIPIPTTGVILQYHGKGSQVVPNFTIPKSMVPWVLYIRPEFDGNMICDFPGQETALWTGYSIARWDASVSYGRLYKQYIYSVTGDAVTLSVHSPISCEWTIWIVAENAQAGKTPFTYNGEGQTNTLPFLLEQGKVYKLGFNISWDGELYYEFHDAQNKLITGGDNSHDARLPKILNAGQSYTIDIFDPWARPTQIVYMAMPKVPPISSWTVNVSESSNFVTDNVPGTPEPIVDVPGTIPQVVPTIVQRLVNITIVGEYNGDWNGRLSAGGAWQCTGNRIEEWKNIPLPVIASANKEDKNVGTLVLKIIYNGQVVAQGSAEGENVKASVYWNGP